MRRAALVLAVAIAASVAPWPSTNRPASSQTAPPEAFSADAAFGHVRRLAGRIGPRPAGSAAYRRAVRYVRGTFDDLGYETVLQGFRLPQGGRSWNVVATTAGEDSVRLLIGAHLDTVGGSPGGNDNASGVSVLLEMARVLAGSTLIDGLALVAFGAEEFQPVGGHHIGSEVYVDRMSAGDREALQLMVSADMVGKVRPFVAAWLRGTSAGAARELARAARASGSRASVRTLDDISDHGPFALAGMPAAFLWTGDEPNHHLPTDVVRNVARRALRRSGAALISLIDRVLSSP
jgi:aminopeptidase YwaD